MSRRVSVIALPGCSAAGLMGAIDLFKVANIISERVNGQPGPLFEVHMLGEGGESVVCSNGYHLNLDGGFDTVRAGDIVYIAPLSIASSGELDHAITGWGPVLDWLKTTGDELAMIATSCSGSFILAEAGLLDNKLTTTAWWLSDAMRQRYPLLTVDTDAVYTQAGNIVCGAATTSFQDVCLAIIEKYAGKHFARLVAKYMMIDNQRRSQAPYAILSLFETEDPVVNKAEQWIRKRLAEDFRIEDVAEHVAVSPRTLIRRFQNSLGESPQSFTQKLRIEKCKTLLETSNLSFNEIVQRCGYSDESAFRRLFKRFCQLSPREYRRRFQAG